MNTPDHQPERLDNFFTMALIAVIVALIAAVIWIFGIDRAGVVGYIAAGISAICFLGSMLTKKS